MKNLKVKTRSCYIETYGCQMNEYDTELIKGILTKAKYDFVDSEYDADVVMLNTCAIRENAHRKAYGRIHDIKYKRCGKKGQARKGSAPLIGILGCMNSRRGQSPIRDRVK